MRAKTVVAIAILGVLLGACGGSSGSSTKAKSASTSAKTSGKASGGGGGEFCTAARNAPNAFRQSSADLATPAGTKKYFDQAKSFIDQVVSITPSAIKGDMQTLATAMGQIVSRLAAVNYDFRKLDASQMQTLSSPQLSAASTHIQQYLASTCGITPSTSLPTTSTS